MNGGRPPLVGVVSEVVPLDVVVVVVGLSVAESLVFDSLLPAATNWLCSADKTTKLLMRPVCTRSLLANNFVSVIMALSHPVLIRLIKLILVLTSNVGCHCALIVPHEFTQLASPDSL